MPEKLKRYYIVKEHPIRIIQKCKAHSKGTLAKYLFGFCILYAMINWVPNGLALIFPATNVDMMAQYTDADPAMLRQMPAVTMVALVYLVLFSGVFRLSEALYALTYIRNRKVEYSALLESSAYYLKALGVFVLQTVITSFWTMFLVIPGLLAALNFSQTFYILADDPDKPVTQILAESKIMMYGNRMNYVRLILCYLPYFMIAYIPTFMLADLAVRMSLNNAAITLLLMAANIPMFLAYGYASLGRTVFYELLNNKSFAEFRYAGQDAFRELEKRSPENPGSSI